MVGNNVEKSWDRVVLEELQLWKMENISTPPIHNRFCKQGWPMAQATVSVCSKEFFVELLGCSVLNYH